MHRVSSRAWACPSPRSVWPPDERQPSGSPDGVAVCDEMVSCTWTTAADRPAAESSGGWHTACSRPSRKGVLDDSWSRGGRRHAETATLRWVLE
jgi:hypothetical protein